MDKLQKRVREVEEEVAAEHVEDHLAEHRALNRDRALLLVGGFKTAVKIATAINSEVMRALEIFQEEKCFEPLGFDRFAEFLDNSEHSPMSKAQYYERKAILEKEGDKVFDLLSDMGVSIRKRKLIGKGNVEVEGDKLIVHDGEEITEIQLNDRSLILETLSALADANADKSAKLDKQKAAIEKHDEKVRELYGEIDAEKARKSADLASDPHAVARVELGLAFSRLSEIARGLSPVEKDQLKDAVLEDVAAWAETLRGCYLTAANKAKAPEEVIDADDWSDLTDDEIFEQKLPEFIDAAIEHIDDNDAELAANL